MEDDAGKGRVEAAEGAPSIQLMAWGRVGTSPPREGTHSKHGGLRSDVRNNCYRLSRRGERVPHRLSLVRSHRNGPALGEWAQLLPGR